jgi:hypothetical protein
MVSLMVTGVPGVVAVAVGTVDVGAVVGAEVATIPVGVAVGTSVLVGKKVLVGSPTITVPGGCPAVLI